MRIGVLGINHKLANLELRELLAKACQRLLGPEKIATNEHHFVLLSTCNRTEVYFSAEDLTSTHSFLLSMLRQDVNEDFDQKLYSYFGSDCLLHLCRVTAGLDSAIIAETEIQGQVKNAYEMAKASCLLPFELHYLFQKSLGIAKKIRAHLPLKPGLPDIEHAILQTGHHFFTSPHEAKTLLIGASAINEKILDYLQQKNISRITICNRTYEKSLAYARKYGVEILPWKDLHSWLNYDWIILGTKAPYNLLHYPIHSPPEARKLVIDLAVPRNADPMIARHPSITLLNIDQINRRLKIRKEKMIHAINIAEELLSTTIQQQTSLFHEKEKQRLRLCMATG